MAMPCEYCGQRPKIPGRGQKWCAECRPEATQKAAEKRGRNMVPQGPAASAADTKRKNRDAPPGTKWCSRCKRYLAVKQFLKSGKCKSCTSDMHHEARLERVFGITPKEYYDLLDSQGGACAICHTVPKRKRLAVDHDHKTGHIRGLLCTQCNHHVLGGAKEDIEILRSAVSYLESPPAKEVLGEKAVPE